jgi:hypothetical protein
MSIVGRELFRNLALKPEFAYLIDLWIFDGSRNGKLQFFPHRPQGTHIIPCNIRNSGKTFTFC